ncbi:hypothetical protein NDA01_19730 [Trichocoleus desertorum AS-A10]|uniref:hypothetical protein n=1 Tax=Trichocoleus desertorum TaxID=1481672 RepID=UPI0032998595
MSDQCGLGWRERDRQIAKLLGSISASYQTEAGAGSRTAEDSRHQHRHYLRPGLISVK